MKLNKLDYLLALTAAVIVFAGCKAPQRLTPLPGYGMKAPGDNERPGGPIEVAPKIDTGTKALSTDTGLKLTGAVDKWVPSAEQPFKADTVYFEYDKSTIKASETAK